MLSSIAEGYLRNRDELRGRGERIRAKAKQVVGDLTDDERLSGEGVLEETTGRIREGVGRTRRKVGRSVENLGRDIKR